MTSNQQPPPIRKNKFSFRIKLVSASIILLALISTLDPFLILFGGILCLGFVFTLQEGTMKLLARRSTHPYMKLSLLLLPALAISSCIVLTCNPITSRNQALRLALGSKPPIDITDLHIKQVAFTDYCVTVFFRSSPSSISKLLENPIYKRKPFPGNLDMSQTYFEDLAYMGIVSNMIVYSRVDIDPNVGGARIMVDSEYHFMFVSYGVD